MRFSTTLLTGVAGVAVAFAAPAAAQETCTVDDFDGTIVCDDPAEEDTDIFLGRSDYGGIMDGAYDNLEVKIAQTAPTEEELAASQAVIDAEAAEADALNDSVAAVDASFTEDDLAAFAARDAAFVAASDAADAEDAALAAAAAAQADRDAAAATVVEAQDGVDAAQAAFDADSTQENLDALNAAEAFLDESQQALAAATTDLNAAQAAATAASQDRAVAFNELAAAQTDLNDSLAANDTFVAAITDAGFAADTTGIQNLQTAAAAADQDVVVAQAEFDALDNDTNTFIRAQEVLVPAAENQNASIAAASQALLGDPRADETNFEVEVVSALVDHETRISANTDAITVNADNIAINADNIAINAQNIAANTQAIAAETAAREEMGQMLMQQITDEQNARIAADNAINARIDDLDDRVSSSTATAIALGGMGFLPDTRFNLAGNVGIYEGAQAIAVNAGVRVSDSFAITGGVGGGLNKGGKVGGRVGFIFGW